MTGATLDRSIVPSGGDPRPFEFPSFCRHTTNSGLELLLLERRELPLLGIQYTNRGGGQYDPPAARGLASLTAAVVDEGTLHRSSQQISEAVEGRGGFLGAGAGWDGSSVSVSLLSSQLDFAVDLIAEVVQQPAFVDQEVERWRALRLGELERRRQDPAALAALQVASAVYGDRVYGGSLLGHKQDIEELQRSSLVDCWQTHCGSRSSFVIAVGDFDRTRMIAALESAFSDLPVKASPEVPDLGAPSLPESVVHIVDRPGAAQTELRIAHVGVPRTHPDRARLVLLNCLLGGKFTSRLNLNLRERNGYTYGARTSFADRNGCGPFVFSAAIESESVGAAISEVLGEINRVQTELVPEAELEETKSYVLGVFPYTLQTFQGLHDRLEDIALYGLPNDYFTVFQSKLRAVTSEHLLDAARSHLDPLHAAVVAVGPAAELEPQMARFGPVQLHSNS